MTIFTEILLELFESRQAEDFDRRPARRPDGAYVFRYGGRVLFYGCFLTAFALMLFFRAVRDHRDALGMAALCTASLFLMLGLPLLWSALFYRVRADGSGLAQRLAPGIVRFLPWSSITGARLRRGTLYLLRAGGGPLLLSGRAAGGRALAGLLEERLEGPALETVRRWAREAEPRSRRGEDF